MQVSSNKINKSNNGTPKHDELQICMCSIPVDQHAHEPVLQGGGKLYQIIHNHIHNYHKDGKQKIMKLFSSQRSTKAEMIENFVSTCKLGDW